MSFIDRRIEPRPTSGEAPFNLTEVFFSRTDERGVIQMGNYVFKRVSGFEWDEILGAPHKIVRHPDMPKAVFWLLWDKLKRGEAVGAYVKNRAKDGLYYWVFATLAPCTGGYLSARIKPTSGLRDTIEQEYLALRQAELDEGLSAEDSATRLLARLDTLGFANYDMFAAHALSEELAARNSGLGKPVDRAITAFRGIGKDAEALKTETAALIDDFAAMRTIPHNLRVIASRLEPVGGPISTLSKNYGLMSREMSDWFETHVMGPQSNFSTVRKSVNDSMFLQGMARVLHECDSQLTSERRRLGDVDMSGERAILRQLVETYLRKSKRGLDRVGDEADRILRACTVMNRHILGLSTTRVMCKIESARLPDAGDSLTDIISQLNLFQERINARLERIARISGDIRAFQD